MEVPLACSRILITLALLMAVGARAQESERLSQFEPEKIQALAQSLQSKGSEVHSEVIEPNPAVETNVLDPQGGPQYFAWVVRQIKETGTVHFAYLIPARLVTKKGGKSVLPNPVPVQYLLMLSSKGVRKEYFKGTQLEASDQFDLDREARQPKIADSAKLWVRKSDHLPIVQDMGRSIFDDLILEYPHSAIQVQAKAEPKTLAEPDGPPPLALENEDLLKFYRAISQGSQPARAEVLLFNPIGTSMPGADTETPFGSEGLPKMGGFASELDTSKTYVVWVQRESSRFRAIHEFYVMPGSRLAQTVTSGMPPDNLRVQDLVAFSFNGIRYFFAQRFQPNDAPSYERELTDIEITQPEIFLLSGAKPFGVSSAIADTMRRQVLRQENPRGSRNWRDKHKLSNDDLEKITAEYVASWEAQINGEQGRETIHINYVAKPQARAYEVYSRIEPRDFSKDQWLKKANHLWVGFELTKEELAYLRVGDCHVVNPIPSISLCMRDLLGLSNHVALSADNPGSVLKLIPEPGCGLDATFVILAQSSDFTRVIAVKDIKSYAQGNLPPKRRLDVPEVEPTGELLECLKGKPHEDMLPVIQASASRGPMRIDDLKSARR